MRACPSGKSEKVADLFGQRVVGRARKDLPLIVLARPHRLPLVRLRRRCSGCTGFFSATATEVAASVRYCRRNNDWFSLLHPSFKYPAILG